MLMATAKQATTIATQAALATRDWAFEMWQSPWTVEFSKNSLRVVDAMMHLFYVWTHVQPEGRIETGLQWGGRFTVESQRCET